MVVARRVLASLSMVISLAVLVLSLTGAIGIWRIKAPVADRANWLFNKVDTRLDIATQGLAETLTSLDRAAERLDSVAQQQREATQQPRPAISVSRMLARTVQRQFTPDMQTAHDKLQTVAEASLVVNTMLEDLAQFPFFQTSGLDTQRLTEMNRQIEQVGPAAWELSRLLGEGGAEPGAEPGAEAELSRMTQTIATVRGLILQYEPQVARVRQQSQDLRALVFRWFTPAVVLISFLCSWIAISQVCLLLRARNCWRAPS